MRHDLPVGSVTLVFTDIEGSTNLLHELGPQGYAQALAQHRRVLREAFGAGGGIEVDTQGDAFFYAFPDPRAAVEAARVGQRGLAAGPIKVRLGIHTGTPHVTDEGYVGSDVNLGARIAAAGHGGQVLISDATRAHVEGDVTDLGDHRLKDFDRPVSIFQLGDERFPPLKTISNTNLPRPASSFVGRRRELEELVRLLQGTARLVTVTGPGGTGKSRLAIEAAAELVPEHRHGVFWIPLPSLHDHDLVTETIAHVLGASEQVVEHVGPKEMLLVLDNFEQVIDAAPQLSQLLMSCPNLKVLVTSRQLLRVAGEVEYPLEPLAENEAVELFCVRSGSEADTSISELCRRLDYLPLAVELAAARTKVLSPPQILERLSRRLDLLRGGRDADARQATLRATIEWSYDLLDDEEKNLFAQLSVFRGGCTLEAAEHVCGADLDVLESLVDKSLVRHVGDRFSMLETVAHLARERLAESDAGANVAAQHVDYFCALVAEAERHLSGDAAPWLDRLETEHDNIRAALDHLEGSGDLQTALEVAGTASLFWEMRGHFTEAGARFERLLKGDPRPTAARANALNGACAMAVAVGDLEVAQLRGQEALELWQELGDARGTAMSQLELGIACATAGEFERARRLFEESAAGFDAKGDEAWAIWATRMLAWMYRELGDLAKAQALHEQNLQRARAAGNRYIEASTLGALAEYAAEAGQLDDARACLRESVLMNLELESDQANVVNLVRLARLLVLDGRAVPAARSLGSADAIYEDLGLSPEGFVMVLRRGTMDMVEARLDEEAIASALQQGTRLSLYEALVLAFDELGLGAISDVKAAGS